MTSYKKPLTPASECQQFFSPVKNRSKGFRPSATLLPPITHQGDGEEEFPWGSRLAHALWYHRCRRVTRLPPTAPPGLLHLHQEATKRTDDVSEIIPADCQPREMPCHFTPDSDCFQQPEITQVTQCWNSQAR